MIRYSNKSGFGVICSRWGSVFNDTAKPALFAAVMTSLVYLSTKGYFGPAAQLDLTSFEHPIAFQSYAFSLAYLVSMRAKLALDRYTSGIENVHRAGLRGGGGVGMVVSGMVSVGLVLGCIEAKFCK